MQQFLNKKRGGGREKEEREEKEPRGGLVGLGKGKKGSPNGGRRRGGRRGRKKEGAVDRADGVEEREELGREEKTIEIFCSFFLFFFFLFLFSFSLFLPCFPLFFGALCFSSLFSPFS